MSNQYHLRSPVSAWQWRKADPAHCAAVLAELGRRGVKPNPNKYGNLDTTNIDGSRCIVEDGDWLVMAFGGVMTALEDRYFWEAYEEVEG